ncbi:TldD/PmbA family protein [Cnuibacter physcomitrellae]|uniref:TldD/PmbA family protein n=1 Tax=Cnuibacter physcomitrellae TaxID=1619308 RepID=UPI002175B7F7|nr:TldD/PmbA family protein [Cnuibacter physcomitrellae]MCS5497816.1 TldD/PmbA family protein [Cnuibacter physcomitrellae]
MTAHDWGDLSDDVAAAAMLAEALDAVQVRGVSYADARLIEAEELRLYSTLEAGVDERVENNLGIGIRVLYNGSWGFASLPVWSSADLRTAAERALANARAADWVSGAYRTQLPPLPPASGRYQTEVVVDPFGVSASARYELLAAVLSAASAPAEIVTAQAGLNAKRQHRHFASTEGSVQHQHFIESGAMALVNAAGNGTLQRRSFPNSFHGNTAQAGWEYVEGLRMVEEADRIGREAVELLTAPLAPSGYADFIIGPAQMALQIHESTGHALELDRILGDEANYAGTSFITKDAAGSMRYGSPAVNITSDPTVPGTRGSFGFDDEGVPASRQPLITEGIIQNFLSTRDSAARIGAQSTGAARSDGWGYLPVCFSTNVFLEPGEGSTEELEDRLGDGFYIDDNRSWSIDERRHDFQFGTEVAYEVKKGRRGRLLRGFSYGGTTPQFWQSVEAVAGPEEFKAFGMPCGKGEPKQWGFLGHGASPTLVRDVRIGVDR